MKTEVEVIVNDIEVMKTAINTAYYKSLSEDMGTAYKGLSNTTRESPLTKLLGQALQKADSYLEIAAKEDESVEEQEPESV